MTEIPNEFIQSLIGNNNIDINTQAMIEHVEYICGQILAKHIDVKFSDRTMRYVVAEKKWYWV